MVRAVAGRRGTLHRARRGHRLSAERDRDALADRAPAVALAGAALDRARARAGAADRVPRRPPGARAAIVPPPCRSCCSCAGRARARSCSSPRCRWRSRSSRCAWSTRIVSRAAWRWGSRCSSRTLPARSRCGCWRPDASAWRSPLAAALAGWTATTYASAKVRSPRWPAYRGVLGRLHAGPDGLVGRTGLRGWTSDAHRRCASALTGGGSPHRLLSLAGLWWLARRDREASLGTSGLAIVGLFCLWSLLVFYHNTNNLIMMLPAFVFLWFADDRPNSASRWVPIVLLQAALMFDVPTRLGPRDAARPLGGGGGRELRSRARRRRSSATSRCAGTGSRVRRDREGT